MRWEGFRLELPMRRSCTIALLLLFGCDRPPSGKAAFPSYKEPRMFAGKWEGHWEHTAFRECGTPENCANSLAECDVQVAESARADWKRLMPDPTGTYWIEFVGRKRAASPAEMADNLDPQECAVEVQRLLTACQSSSPLYPDSEGQRPACASTVHAGRSKS